MRDCLPRPLCCSHRTPSLVRLQLVVGYGVIPLSSLFDQTATHAIIARVCCGARASRRRAPHVLMASFLSISPLFLSVGFICVEEGGASIVASLCTRNSMAATLLLSLYPPPFPPFSLSCHVLSRVVACTQQMMCARVNMTPRSLTSQQQLESFPGAQVGTCNSKIQPRAVCDSEPRLCQPVSALTSRRLS